MPPYSASREPSDPWPGHEDVAAPLGSAVEATPAGQSPALRFELHTELSTVRGLVSKWEALVACSLDPAPFVEPDWLISWWERFAEPDDELRLGAVWRGDELAGIAPLLARRETYAGRRRTVLRFWSNPHSNRINFVVPAADPCPPMARIVKALGDALQPWDLARLEPLSATDRTTGLFLEEVGRAGYRFGTDEVLRSPFLTLPSSWQELERSLSSSYRESVRRKLRAAERHRLRTEITTDASGIADVLAVSTGSWQYAAGTGVASTADVRAFYEAVVSATAARGELQIPVLRRGREAIAFELNLVRNGTVFNLKQAYRQSAAHLSPGIVLRAYVLRHAIESGATEFDFLGESDEHKVHWTRSARTHERATLFGAGLHWRLLHQLHYRVKPWARRHVPVSVTIARTLRRALRR